MDLDNAFQFSNIQTQEMYSLYADENEPINEYDKGVVEVAIGAVFIINKTMRFLFDYKDEWIFSVLCIDINDNHIEGSQVLEIQGKAPSQYEDEEVIN